MQGLRTDTCRGAACWTDWAMFASAACPVKKKTS